jgi:asparagine synthase (glutamine-hydrolysing)
MKAFLAVSLGPDAPDRLRRPDPQALACLGEDATAAGASTAEPIEVTDGGWVAFAGPDPDDSATTVDGGRTVRLGRSARTLGRDVPAAELAGMLDGARQADLVSLLPPFAVVHRKHRSALIVVAGDWLGFHQLYWWSADGAAAVSTSARALSVLAGGGFDPAGLGAQALIGWQVADATLFAGVHALPPATIATLDRGMLHRRQYAQPFARPDRAPALDDAVEEMASILCAWQTAYLDDHPEAVLQLTGGHDSRILLAAIPAARRPGLHALTLGDPDSPDAEIAAGLAASQGIQHMVYRLDTQRWPTPQEAHDLAVTAARALECQASPLALAPLLLAEAHLEQGHRLSGLGGEVARGFYYAGQPAGATTSPQLVERLAHWRLFSNESVEARALSPRFLARARDATIETLRGLFAPGDWLRATDEFYLFHRMHRWAGAHGTVAAVRRHYINPMFDRRFVELALAVTPADKRDSLLLGRLMRRLDPELARIPLDSGLTPARLGTRSVVTRLATETLAARKAVQKVRQRLTHAKRPQMGAPEAAALVLRHWRAEPKACHGLYAVAVDGTPVIDHGWLDEVLAGARQAEPTTVAFLVDLLAATEQSVVS